MPNTDRQITLRFLAAPTDAGNSGNVSGGRVLEWVDKAGYACAVGWAGTYRALTASHVRCCTVAEGRRLSRGSDGSAG